MYISTAQLHSQTSCMSTAPHGEKLTPSQAAQEDVVLSIILPPLFPSQGIPQYQIVPQTWLEQTWMAVINDGFRCSFFNSLAAGGFEWNFRWVIFKLCFSYWWLSYLLCNCHQVVALDFIDIKSILVQIMARCHKPLPKPMLTQIHFAIWRL